MNFHNVQNDETLLAAEAVTARLRVRGADAAMLRGLLSGRPVAPAGISLDIDNPDADVDLHSERAPIVEPLPDGEFMAASGGPARIALRPSAGAPSRLVPQSLNLGLAQQWARSGRMMVHGACLRAGDRGILVLGRKASGKSVLCLAALAAALPVVSDDWLLLASGSDTTHAERLREFLMLRESWASRRLGIQWTGGIPSPAQGRPKRIIATATDDPTGADSFPRAARITELWLLRRPQGARANTTRTAPLPRSAALAALIESTMPLLFSERFPIERNQLMTSARRLIERMQPRQITTGTDLVEAPAATLERLLGEAKNDWNRK